MVYRVKQSNEVKTLIEEVDEEYLFWHPHQDEGYTIEERIVLPSLLFQVVNDDAVMTEDATAEGKESENVSLNLDDVSATTTTTAADDIDNAKFQYSTESVPTAATTTAPVICMDSVSTKDVSSNLSVAVADDDDDDIVLENVRQYQHQRLNTLTEEVNEEYLFWCPHRLVSNEEVTLNEICTEIVSKENVVISNVNVAAVYYYYRR